MDDNGTMWWNEQNRRARKKTEKIHAHVFVYRKSHSARAEIEFRTPPHQM